MILYSVHAYILNTFQAIDIWMGACTAFIFAALLEFTLTNYLWRKGHKGRSTERSRTSFGFADGIGAAMAAATGGGALGSLDPVVSSAAVAGAASVGGMREGHDPMSPPELQMSSILPKRSNDEEQQLFASELNGNSLGPTTEV